MGFGCEPAYVGPSRGAAADNTNVEGGAPFDVTDRSSGGVATPPAGGSSQGGSTIGDTTLETVSAGGATNGSVSSNEVPHGFGGAGGTTQETSVSGEATQGTWGAGGNGGSGGETSASAGSGGKATSHSSSTAGNGSGGRSSTPEGGQSSSGGSNSQVSASTVLGGAGGATNTATSAGGGGGRPSGGTTSTSSIVLPPVHGAAESIGNGLVRVTYNFDDDAQLLDWEVADFTRTALRTALSREDSQLEVRFDETALDGGDLAAVRFKFPIRVTTMTCRSTVLRSRRENLQHTNFYLAATWDGDWAPPQGYGHIFMSSRLLTRDNDSVAGVSNRAFSNDLSIPYNHRFTMTASSLVWTTWPADPFDTRAPADFSFPTGDFYQGTLRHIYLGGYESTNRFDDIVIEGQFNGY